MTFTVENETGLAAANSYASVSELDAFVADRGLTLTASSPTEKEQILVKACDHLENLYRHRYGGEIEFPSTPQRLSFPRKYLYDAITGKLVSGVPLAIKEAQLELAVIADSSDLVVNPTVDPSGQKITRQKLGPLEQEFSDSLSVSTHRTFSEVGRIVSRYLTGGGGTRVLRN
jgi:hypothetical protein